MPQPENVKPRNFDTQTIIYSNQGFSIAWGRWEDGSMVLGMRWDGNETDQGYPKTFGHPVWFIIPQNLRIPILQSLLTQPNINLREMLDVLSTLLSDKKEH